MSYKFDKSKRRQSERRSTGNIIILSVAILALLLVFFFAVPWKLILLGLCHGRHDNAVQAASLAAASELSHIVINDPYYGYIGLSDSPPVGTATTAADGEPTPVIGINTLIGTARLDLLLAHRLQNNELIAMAEQDVEASRKAAKRLEAACKKAIEPDSRDTAVDLNGKPIKPYEAARSAYMSSLGWSPLLGQANMGKFSLSLGWLADHGSTTTQVPVPEKLSQTPESAQQNGRYKPFIDIPAFGESFYFVGVGPQPALVDARQFREADGKRICTVVKVEAEMERDKGPGLHNVACAQPYGVAEANPTAVMRINFPEGVPNSVSSLHDLLSDARLSVCRTEDFTATGGDVPINQGAVLVADQSAQEHTMGKVLARCLYDWIRIARVKPRLDSLVDAMDASFRILAQNRTNGLGSLENPCFTFEFDVSGNVVVRNCNRNPFIDQIVYDNQSYAITSQPVAIGSGLWSIGCRDEVRRLGTVSGGKHAGQPVVGNPVNWCELAYFDRSPEESLKRAKGSKALGLIVTGNNQGCAGGRKAVSWESAQFSRLDGGAVLHPPRKSYYSGGLPVDIEFSQANGSAE